MAMNYSINSENVVSTTDYIESIYSYTRSSILGTDGYYRITPKTEDYTFRTSKQLPKLGLMLVGLGGNNGTTVYGGITANKFGLSWYTKRGLQEPNYFGSITQCSTTKIGTDVKYNKEIFLALKDILPMVNPNDLVVHGWDISKMNLFDALKRAQVFEYDLVMRLEPYMKDIIPLPGVYYPDFIAANQESRADNILPGKNKQEHLEKIRKDIQEFRKANGLDKVIVLWTANTERMTEEKFSIHGNCENLLNAIRQNESEISPSTIFAVASILEGCSFINGSPQNTIVPGVIELAKSKNVFVVGNDFKSGQTKFKTLFTDFLVQAGIKPKAIVSYNHLGNNDGKNLSSESQFKSKEKSKSSCVDDILASNPTLYKNQNDLHIDHCIVIKYIPATGDTKKALDEYMSEIFMGGQHVISVYNVCEDSLLAAPIIIDLVLLTELFERIEVRRQDEEKFHQFERVLSVLGYLTKAPLTKPGIPVINSLFRQRNCIENIFKICAGIPLENNTMLEYYCKKEEVEEDDFSVRELKRALTDSHMKKQQTGPKLGSLTETRIK
jgi:myo-inositol-1-phosphate synthase